MTKLGILSVDSFTLAILRTVASVPFALAIIWMVRGKLPWRGRDKFHLLGMAVTGLIGFPVLFTLGVSHTTAGHAAVAQTAMPLFAGLLEALDNRRWPALKWWGGHHGGVWWRGDTDRRSHWCDGHRCHLAGRSDRHLGFVFRGPELYLRLRLVPRYGSVSVTMWSVVVAGILLLPFLTMRLDALALASITLTGWLAILYLSVGASILAYITWIYALTRGGISRMVAWQYASRLSGLPRPRSSWPNH